MNTFITIIVSLFLGYRMGRGYDLFKLSWKKRKHLKKMKKNMLEKQIEFIDEINHDDFFK